MSDQPLRDLTAFQIDLLLTISEADPHPKGEHPHGVSVKDRLASERGEDVNPGRFYPNLESLVGMGLVRRIKIDDRTNGLTLTPEGKTVLRSLLGRIDRALVGVA